MSPTVFSEGPFRFFFLSREEPRIHIHVQHSDGEAKIWLEPRIEVDRAYGLSKPQVNRALRIVQKRESEIRAAWQEHFGD